MAHLKDDNINFEKLETGVQKAMADENLYWLQNDAKFRAVKQKGTYDDFKEIVAAAHLKPLDKGDKLQLEGKIVCPWNVTARDQSATSVKQSYAQDQHNKIPKTPNEFTLEWRKQKTSEEKALYIHHIISSEHGPECLRTIFKNEIPFGLLGDLLKIISSDFDSYDIQCVTATLLALSQTGRFSMSLTFLSSDERDVLSSLLGRLETEGADCAELRKMYGI